MERTTRRAVLGIIAAAATCAGIQDAPAARIYNFTNQPIDVNQNRKNGGVRITLQPGARSDSLEWAVALPVEVWHPFGAQNGYPICKFDFYTKEIVGGNYMLVVQKGHSGTCTLCDASRRIRFQKSFTVKPGSEYTTPGHNLSSCE